MHARQTTRAEQGSLLASSREHKYDGVYLAAVVERTLGISSALAGLASTLGELLGIPLLLLVLSAQPGTVKLIFIALGHFAVEDKGLYYILEGEGYIKC